MSEANTSDKRSVGESQITDATELLFLDSSLTIPEPNKSLLARFKSIWNTFLDRIKFD